MIDKVVHALCHVLLYLFKSVLIYIMHLNCDCMSMSIFNGTRILSICISYRRMARRNGCNDEITAKNHTCTRTLYVLIRSELVCSAGTANVLAKDQSERQKLSRSNMHIKNKSGYSSRYETIREKKEFSQLYNSAKY